jgi:hypothetical protein
MNPRRIFRDRRPASSAILPVLAALVVCGLIAAGASASPPQNAAEFNEVGGLPTITGPTPTPVSCPNCGVETPKVGDTLAATTGTWSQAPPPSSFAYEWKRCAIDDSACATIAGATGSTYKPVAADVTHVLVVTVTASNKDGSGKATSLPTGIVATANGPSPYAVPTLSGLVIVGRELSVSNGVWIPGASSYTIQWQRCNLEAATSMTSGVTITTVSAAIGCVDVAGATKSTYGVTAADLAHRIRAVVTAKTAAGETASAISNTSSLTIKATPRKKKK